MLLDGNDACSRSAFRTFPFEARKYPESNPGARSAIADPTFAFACGDSLFDHRSFAAA
jgi:hypothetical protein